MAKVIPALFMLFPALLALQCLLAAAAGEEGAAAVPPTDGPAAEAVGAAVDGDAPGAADAADEGGLVDITNEVIEGLPRVQFTTIDQTSLPSAMPTKDSRIRAGGLVGAGIVLALVAIATFFMVQRLEAQDEEEMDVILPESKVTPPAPSGDDIEPDKQKVNQTETSGGKS